MWLPALLQPWLGCACLVVGGEVAGASTGVRSSVLAGEAQLSRAQPEWSWEWCCPGKHSGGDHSWAPGC